MTSHRVLPSTSSVHRLALVGDVFVQVFRAPPDHACAQDMRRIVDQLPKPTHTQLIVLALQGGRAPEGEVRTALADAAKLVSQGSKLSAFVVETPGFVGATARAVVAGIAFLMPGKSKTFGNLEEAAKEIAAVATGVTAAELVDVVKELSN